MKKLCIIPDILLFMLFLMPIHANETQGLVFDGDANEFIVQENNTKGFEDMMPGETRTFVIQLTNQDYREMSYYVKAENSKTLGKDVVYDVTFLNNSETFFKARVGGPKAKGIPTLEENYLLKKLKKGESSTVEIQVHLDGTSMDNTYQGTQGDLGLVFSVEFDENKPVDKVIDTIANITGVKTGDVTRLGAILAVFLGSAVFVILLLVKRRKERDDEHA